MTLLLYNSTPIKDKLQCLLNPGAKTDCAFICGEERIPAHKLILAYSSPVFESMFFGKMASSEINLPDINPKDFKQVLDFIYTDTIKIENIHHAWTFIYISQKYFLRDLLEFCVGYITRNISMESLLLCYEYSQLYNIKRLAEDCWKDILRYAKGLLCVNYHMKLSTLYSILKEIKLDATQADLTILIAKWAMDECEINEIEISEETIFNVLCDKKLLDDFNLSKFNKAEYEFTDYMAQIDCYAKINEVVHIIQNLQLNPSENSKIITNRFAGFNLFMFRNMYKISRGYFFSKRMPIVNDVSVSQNIYLFGLAITSLHQPAGVDSTTYDSLVDVQITHDDQTYYRCSFKQDDVTYNDVQNLSLPVAVKLEAQKLYTVIVTYHNNNANAKGQVVLHYCGEHLVNKRNSTVITFTNELEGSVVQGLYYVLA